MSQLLLASSNRGKLRELQSMLRPHGIDVLSPSGLGLALEVAETGTTFAENARIKAEAYLAASGLPSLADDSGLVVDALRGEPGVHSARYGGSGLTDADRVRLVLQRLRHVPDAERSARFVAVLALARPGEDTVTFDGAVQGRIAPEPRGTGGFGYDPIFYYPPYGCTFGELDPARKDEVSHRGQAVRKAVDYLLAGRGRIY